jgi:hypothetical protein
VQNFENGQKIKTGNETKKKLSDWKKNCLVLGFVPRNTEVKTGNEQKSFSDLFGKKHVFIF